MAHQIDLTQNLAFGNSARAIMWNIVKSNRMDGSVFADGRYMIEQVDKGEYEHAVVIMRALADSLDRGTSGVRTDALRRLAKDIESNL